MSTTPFYALPAATLKCWRLEWLLLLGGLLAVLLGLYCWLDETSAGPRLLLLYCSLGVGLLLALMLWLCGPSHRRRSWRLADSVLVIRSGIWFRKETLVARERVQYVDVRQSPLHRHFGLATLVIFTAGAQLPAIRLEGIAIDTALDLRAVLAGEAHD